MYYVYVLKATGGDEIYIGYTVNLKRRFHEHNADGKKWVLAYYEAYKARKDALLREKKLRHYGWALRQLKDRLQCSLI